MKKITRALAHLKAALRHLELVSAKGKKGQAVDLAYSWIAQAVKKLEKGFREERRDEAA